jgi:hypothetical protein
MGCGEQVHVLACEYQLPTGAGSQIWKAPLMNADTIFAVLVITAGSIFGLAVVVASAYGVYQVALDILEGIEDNRKAQARLDRLDAAKAKRDAANAEWKRERAAQEERIARQWESYRQ